MTYSFSSKAELEEILALLHKLIYPLQDGRYKRRRLHIYNRLNYHYFNK